jgi:hypothetical protein
MVAPHRSWSVIFLVIGAACVAACGRAAPPANAEKRFVGSDKCATCHQDIYNRWKNTLMAKVIQDPATHPDAIVGDFSTPNPLVTFRKEDIAFTYGSKWKQRYFTKRGDDYYVFPAQWDVQRQDLAPLLRRARNRLVGRALSRGSDAAPDRSALRRLPFGQLRHQDEDRH